MQDILTFTKWFKRFFIANCEDNDPLQSYDPVAVRGGLPMGDPKRSGRPKSSIPRVVKKREKQNGEVHFKLF